MSTTPLTDLITDYRNRRHLMATLRDFSDFQVRAFAAESIKEISRLGPRKGVTATVEVVADEKYVVLPEDWHSYERLEDLGSLIWQPAVYGQSGYGYGYSLPDFNSTLSQYATGTRKVFRPRPPAISTNTDGRAVLPLAVIETADRDVEIVYNAFHTVRDEDLPDVTAVNTLDPETRMRVIYYMLWLAGTQQLKDDPQIDRETLVQFRTAIQQFYILATQGLGNVGLMA